MLASNYFDEAKQLVERDGTREDSEKIYIVSWEV